MMLVGVGLAVVFLVGHAGGPTPALSALRPDQLTLFGVLSPREALALFLPTMCLLLGEANMYQKFFSAKNERAAKVAVAGWIAGTILVETLIDSVGVFGSVAVPGLSPAESETIVVRVALDVLPTLLGVLLLCGAAAIIVSTANSFLLTPATNLMRDVYQRFVDPAVSDRHVLLYTRVLVVVIGAIAFAIGNAFPTILAMALWAYTMYGAGITPALLAAFVWPRATRTGGVASIAIGMLTTLIWEIVALARGTGGHPDYLFGLETVYPALVFSIAGLVLVSLLTPPDPRTL
jgi:SSS family solute:Na+ symporter/sodium/proline symporter